MLMAIIGAQSPSHEEEKGFSLLSTRGSIAVDTRTNSLIIKEIPQNLAGIKKLVAKLDIPVEQVEIEARIVSVDLGTLEDIGVRWGIKKTARNYKIGGTIEGNDAGIESSIDRKQTDL